MIMPLRYYVEPRGEPVSVPCPASGVELETFIPWTLVKRGAKKEVITPIDAPEAFTVEAASDRQRKKAEQHSPVDKALGLAIYWQSLLDEGKFASLTEIARAEGIDRAYVSRVFRLTRVSPTIVEQALAGKVSMEVLMAMGACWLRQEVNSRYLPCGQMPQGGNDL
jgi:hypothetical protein